MTALRAVRLAPGLFGLIVAACTTYHPEPVDLAEHARAFAARLPDGDAVRTFAQRLAERDPTTPTIDLADGLSLTEGRLLALLFAPEPRLLRARAGVAAAVRDASGRWQDPVLHGDFARILESVQHPWLAGGALELTLPLTGRSGLERELAGSQHAQALAAARTAEARAIDTLETAWVHASAARQRTQLLAHLIDDLRALEAIAERLQQSGALTNVGARTFALERVARTLELQQAEAAAADAEAACRAAMGLPPNTAQALAPTLAIEPRAPSADADADAPLADGPRLCEARAAHAAAERALELAIAEQWPQLSLLPGWQEEDGQPRAALGFQLPLPLWNGNARAIAEATGQRRVAAETLRTTLEQATQELARAERRRTAALALRAAVDRDLLPLAAQQIDDARRLAAQGQLDPLLQLDALLRAHTARVQALDAAAATALATIERNSLFWPVLATGAEDR